MTPADPDRRDHSRADAALREWRQGDCVLGPDLAFVHRFNPDLPVTSESVETPEQEGDLLELPVRGLVVLTQTCDLVRPCEVRPFVEVSPVVEISPAHVEGIRLGRRPRYGYIPAIANQYLVADLDRVMTVEKGVVAVWPRTRGCLTDQDVRAFSHALAKKRQRFAFPDAFVRLVTRLSRRLQEKHGRESEEGHALRSLCEIRVSASPSWTAAQIQLFFHFIRDDQSTVSEETWNRLLGRWLALVPHGDSFTSVNGQVVMIEDLTAKDYLESEALELDHLSIGESGQ